MWRGYANSTTDGDEEEVASSYAASDSGSQHLKKTTDALQSSEQSGEDSYGEDDFDEYSDEFEADDDDGGSVAGYKESAKLENSTQFFRVGDRVQVYWDEESEWFDGFIAHVEAHRCFVRYTDGEEQWEPVEIIRPAPPTTTQPTEQLQLVVDTSLVLTDRRVIVYWRDELSWFEGCIVETTTAGGTTLQSIHVVYDDGDHQWITRAAFRDVLLAASSAGAQTNPSSLDQLKSMKTGIERYLTPRKYTPAVATHFEPVRVARPYRCSVRHHIGSITTPRRAEEQRRPFYCRVDITLDFQAASCQESSQLDCTIAMRNCEIQTEIAIGPTSSA